MKMPLLILLSFGVWIGSSSRQFAQSPYTPVAPPPRATQLPQPQPPVRPANPIAPPDGAVPTNPTVGGDIVSPEQAPTGMDANQTNPATSMPPTNNLAQTNMDNPAQMSVTNPAFAATLALTNRLSQMSPVQAQSVIQVQIDLNSLQELAVNVGEVPSVQIVIQQNPQIQRQIHQCSNRILALARGPVRPSVDSVDRLSLDFFRACSRARLAREHQLVLAIIINSTCNSQNLTAAQVEESLNHGLIVLRTAGVPAAICTQFGCDLRSIAAELQPNLQI